MPLYSYKTQYPTIIPFRITLSDGRTRTDPATFSSEEIADAGYIAVAEPPLAPYPARVDWDGTDWFIREPNEVETNARWDQIKKDCEDRLKETDYKVIKAVELGLPMDPMYVQYRQELRDLYNNVNNVDPWTVATPQLQAPNINDEL